MYKWQRIKALHAQGVSIGKIAKTVGVSRNTVRKYLRDTNPPRFNAREYTKQLDRELVLLLVKRIDVHENGNVQTLLIT